MRSDSPVLRWLKKRTVAHFAIVALCVVPMIGLLSIKPSGKHPYATKIKLWFDAREYSSIDYRIHFGRTAPVDPRIVLLSIDSPSISLDALSPEAIAASPPLSLMREGNGFPFPRAVYAYACDQLFQAGTKVVAFDLIFQKPSPTDALFQQTLEKYHNQTVIGLNFNDDSTSYALPPPSLLPSQDPMDDRLGYFNYWRDSDEIIRCAQYRNNLDYESSHPGAELLPKLDSLAARTVDRAGYPNLVPDDLQARPMRFAGPSRFPTFSFYKLFDSHSWNKDFRKGEFFRGKIVLIGPEGNWFKDVLPTPWGPQAGAEIHLNSINALLQNEFLHPPSDVLTYSIVAFSGLLALGLATALASIAWRFLAAVLLLAGYGLALMGAYNGPGLLLPAIAPIGVFCAATGVGYIYDFVLTQIEKLRLRTTFERYNSKNVVKYLLEHTDSYEQMQAGTRRPVTVLFSDIRGFTTIVEEAEDSHKLVAKLNEYLTEMVACVFKYDGSLDKFMGDGLMAVWGNTPYNFGPKEDAVRAVRAALAMLVALRKLNEKWLAEGDTEWRIGIGLNHGQVIVGDMGSQQHKEFAVVGDAINLGSRLEGLTKEYRLEILLGETVADLVREEFHLRSVDIVQVKGKSKSVLAFAVLGEKSHPLPKGQQELLSLHEEGIVAFRRRDFTVARDLFRQAQDVQPDDFLTAQYLASSTACIENPPDDTWTGVRIMTRK